MSDEPLIQRALRTAEQQEIDIQTLGADPSTSSMPVDQLLLLAVFIHELRSRRRQTGRGGRPEQFIRAAREAQIPEEEIQAAIELAGRHAAGVASPKA